MSYKITYVDQVGYIKTPRGNLLVECIFNSETVAREHGYEMYFSLNRGLCIFTKHIDVYHVLFAVVDKQAPFKYKQIADKVYYVDMRNFEKTILIPREKLLRLYQTESKTYDKTFSTWCYENMYSKVKQGTTIQFCKEVSLRKANEKYCQVVDMCMQNYYVQATSKSDRIYLEDDSCSKFVATVSDINKAGVKVIRS